MTTRQPPPETDTRAPCGHTTAYPSEWSALTAATTLRWTGRSAHHAQYCPHYRHWHLTVPEAR